MVCLVHPSLFDNPIGETFSMRFFMNANEFIETVIREHFLVEQSMDIHIADHTSDE